MPPKRKILTAAEKKQQEGAASQNAKYLQQKLAELHKIKERNRTESNSTSDEEYLEKQEDQNLPARTKSTNSQEHSSAGSQISPTVSPARSEYSLENLSDDESELNVADHGEQPEGNKAANDADTSGDVFDHSENEHQSVPKVASDGSDNENLQEMEGDFVPRADFEKLKIKLSKKNTAYKNLQIKKKKLEVELADQKEICVHQAKIIYKLKTKVTEVTAYSAVEGIDLTAAQIEQISAMSKSVGMFAQNLAVAILGVDNFREMSVTGRKYTQSKDAVAKPAIPQKVFDFIHDKALQRSVNENGGECLSWTVADAQRAIVNKALADKIGNLRKAHVSEQAKGLSHQQKVNKTSLPEPSDHQIAGPSGRSEKVSKPSARSQPGSHLKSGQSKPTQLVPTEQSNKLDEETHSVRKPKHTNDSRDQLKMPPKAYSQQHIKPPSQHRKSSGILTQLPQTQNSHQIKERQKKSISADVLSQHHHHPTESSVKQPKKT